MDKIATPGKNSHEEEAYYSWTEYLKASIHPHMSSSYN